MAFNLSALSNYTNEVGHELVAKMVANGNTADYVTIQPGIKSAMKIPVFNTTLFGTVQACGWTPSGTTTISQVTCTVTPLQLQDKLCLVDAETKFLQYQLAAGRAGLEDVVFAEKFVDEKLAQIKLYNDQYFWANATYGIVKQLITASASTVNTDTGTAWSTANAVSILDNFKTKVPAAIKGMNDITLFVGQDTFDIILVALKNANYYHIDPTMDINYVMQYLGLTIVGVAGLNGTGAGICTSKQNIIMGTDLMSDTDTIDVWYSKDNNEIRLAAYWKIGGCVLFPEFCVVKSS